MCDKLNCKAISAHPAAQQSLKEKEFHQAILDAGYAAWQSEPKWGYADMLENAETFYGEAAKLFIMLGKYNQQVCNGGHFQYYDNNYASEGKSHRDTDTDISLHKEMINLFKSYRLDVLPLGAEVLKIMEAFHIEKDEEREITESCGDCGGSGCENCDRGEVTVDNQEYGNVSNCDDLDKLDTAYYEIYERFMGTVEQHVQEWFAKDANPISQTAVPFDPFDLSEPTAKAVAALPENKPRVKLIGQDGNAFRVMGAAQKAMRQFGLPKEKIDEYMKEAMSGDYDHLLATTMKYCDVH